MPPKDPSTPRRKPPRIGPSLAKNLSASSSPSSLIPQPAITTVPPGEVTPKTQDLPAYEFLGYLPESYGTRKLFLVPRDPHLLFAYWDLNPAQYREAAQLAKDGRIFLELYVPGEGRVQQIHVWDSHKNWYLPVNRPDTPFLAQLGYYKSDGAFEVLARSSEVRTPRDSLSPHTDARFVTLPFHLKFQELFEIIAERGEPGEPLVDTLARLQRSNHPLPFAARIPRDLTPAESEQLLGYLGDEEVRQRMIGSFEITEILRKRFEATLSSGQWTSSPGGFSSPSSPFGGFSGRERDFRMHLNAELIIYGGTEPSAQVRIDGHDIALSPDGTFSYHFVFPDGQFHIPIGATSADGVETRSALLSFLRVTETAGDVKKTGQPKQDEPIGRQK